MHEGSFEYEPSYASDVSELFECDGSAKQGVVKVLHARLPLKCFVSHIFQKETGKSVRFSWELLATCLCRRANCHISGLINFCARPFARWPPCRVFMKSISVMQLTVVTACSGVQALREWTL